MAERRDIVHKYYNGKGGARSVFRHSLAAVFVFLWVEQHRWYTCMLHAEAQYFQNISQANYEVDGSKIDVVCFYVDAIPCTYNITTPFLDPNMNVFGSQNRYTNLTDPNLVISQDSILGYRVRVAPP